MNGCFQANILAVYAIPPRYCLQLSPDFGTLADGLSCSSLGRGPEHTRPSSRICLTAFGVCQDLIGGEALASYQSLYLRQILSEAAPKYISGSTSYLQV